MDIERTFWEKATLIHVASVKRQRYWEVYARHWYDLIRIVPTGDIQSALKPDYVGLAGMFERDPYVFDILIDKCKQMDKTSEEWS